MKQPRTIAKEFGRSIRFWRKYENLTLRQVEERSGISRGLLSNIENGKGNPSLLTIHKLGDALGHHPTDLLAD